MKISTGLLVNFKRLKVNAMSLKIRLIVFFNNMAEVFSGNFGFLFVGPFGHRPI
jgi:hypothetical protein